MAFRRVLPLACLLPLACSSKAPAPGAGGVAPADSLSAARESAPLPTAVDTSWPVRPVPRWGFSFRWPEAHALAIVGPRDATCDPLPPQRSPYVTYDDSLYHENGQEFMAGDPGEDGDITLQFVREAAVDSVLADEFFRRSASSPSGWVGLGRYEMETPARFSRGGRWWELFANVQVGVSNPDGGMVPEDINRSVAVVTRPDRCRMVLTWGRDLLDPSSESAVPRPVELWRLLESIRFTGEDETHELRALQAFSGFDWRRRLGLIYPTLFDGACLMVANATAPEGAPVLALETGGQARWFILSPPGKQCASVPRQPGDSLHFYEVEPALAGIFGGSESIGVLAPPHPINDGDPLPADLDGDGRPDSFGFCSARGLYWGYVRSGSPTGPVVWKLGIHWPERSGPRCPAEVAP